MDLKNERTRKNDANVEPPSNKKTKRPKQKSPKNVIKKDSAAEKKVEDDTSADAARLTSTKRAAAKTNRNLLNLEMNKFFNMSCELCLADKFETFTEVKKHYAEEHNQKGYLRCSCDCAFSELPRIIEHIKYHLNPLDFQCDRCPDKRIFRRKTSLKRHYNLTHNDVDDEQQYQCDMCPSKFSKPHKLERHKFRNHSSDENKRFICDICDKRYVFL